MKILAIEFSSSQRGVALLDQEGDDASQARLASQVEVSGRETHSAGMVSAVLDQLGLVPSRIDRLAVGLGPGSYTGIRHALAFAQGWQLAHGTPVVGISSARTMASQMKRLGHRGHLGIVIDALRKEFYLGLWDLDDRTEPASERLHLVEAARLLQLQQEGVALAGPLAALPLGVVREVYPSAAELARLALSEEGTTQAETLAPIYLRTMSFVKGPPPRQWPE